MKSSVTLYFFIFFIPAFFLAGSVPCQGSEKKEESGGLHISFADSNWDGGTVPQGQQCQKFGGNNPHSPRLIVKNIPKEANALIMEYSDRSYSPMDNGGHGRMGFIVAAGVSEVTVPSVPGHSYELPEGFFLVKEHLAPKWDKAGAYMPPCSGGRGNSYYVTVKAVQRKSEDDLEGTVLAMGILEMGRY